jgi:mannose-6-phosphate isomerase-like protein (cupin superfamily)
MIPTPNPPGPVGHDELRVRNDTSDGGFKVGVAVDAESHGSPVLLGLAWIRPGTERVSWTADRQTHEAYYLSSGSVRIGWEEPEPRDTEIEAGAFFYFPPGRSYWVENAGEVDALIVWTTTPSPAWFE